MVPVGAQEGWCGFCPVALMELIGQRKVIIRQNLLPTLQKFEMREMGMRNKRNEGPLRSVYP